MFSEMFERPSPGLAVLTCRVFSCRCGCVRGWGLPLPGWGDGQRGRGGRGEAARGARRDSPEGGTGGTPAGGCKKTILIQKQRPDRPVGALREVGERNTVREGKKKSFAGIIIIMEVKT